MSLREADDKRALSVLEEKAKRPKKPRLRRCSSCGYLYPLDELHPDYDDQERQIGMICDSCI